MSKTDESVIGDICNPDLSPLVGYEEVTISSSECDSNFKLYQEIALLVRL